MAIAATLLCCRAERVAQVAGIVRIEDRKWPGHLPRRASLSNRIHRRVQRLRLEDWSRPALDCHHHRRRELRVRAVPEDARDQASSVSSSERAEAGGVATALHAALAVGLLVAFDQALKRAFVTASISFPSALFGMFLIFMVLVTLDAIGAAAASRSIFSYFEPGLSFIQRWLPLFYVPSLVMLPLAVSDIPLEAGAKIVFILMAGWVASLAATGWTAMAVRALVQTEMSECELMAKPPPFTSTELSLSFAAQAAGLLLFLVSPQALGSPAVTALPFFLAATVAGYVFGSRLPADAKKILHPILTCTLAAQAAALVLSVMTGSSFTATLATYMTKSAGAPGAGDFLMSFLGSVILSFAFSMYQQRRVVQRHASEIFAAVIASALFSLFSTALAGRLLGLDSDLTRAIVPRCITVALALPVANLLQAPNLSLTAAVVVVTGLVGANFVQLVMDRLGFKDPIVRGLATACSAHGLGTAALSAKEPEALPFCAIAYALTGIASSVLVAIPVVRESLIVVIGP